jgi:TolA-binding protein
MKRANRLAISAAMALLSLLAGPSQAADDATPTVGSITRNNDLTANGHLEVKTPSILRITLSKPLPANPREAIAQYDRLLELTADADIRAEALRRSADLRVQLSDASGDPDEPELRKAIASYQRLLKEMPDYERNDRVLYQMARAYQLIGDNALAIDTLRSLVDRYPDSARMGDAAFRAAEWLYASGRYDEAEQQYHAVLRLDTGNPLFESAQYKYGWSLFKQGKYDQALAVFLPILDRDLPAGELTDPVSALSAPAKSRNPYTAETLRVSSLSFAALGGGKAMNEYFSQSGSEPRYSTLLYNALGSLLLEKRRYGDAADTYAAFIARHPDHALAPDFQVRVVAAYQQGGFNDRVIAAKEAYATRYAPGSPYWGSRAPPDAVMSELRKDLDELGRYYQAHAQQTPGTETTERQADFMKAASWYQRTLELFPNAPEAAGISLLCADALYDGGQTEAAAKQYAATAYGYAGNPKAPEAAYASVQAWQRLALEVPASAQENALRQSVDASLKLADSFPNHSQLARVLTRSAGDLYAIKDYDRAIAVAQRSLQQPAAVDLQREALGVVADSRFAQRQYPQAETAYQALIRILAPDGAEFRVANEQLAASIYKQGEAARDAGNLRAAADAFQRVGRLAPGSTILANADYDAAAAFLAMQDWKSAQAVLETFRTRYPAAPLLADADKKLAFAYQKDNRPAQAAEVYARIALRDSETPETRRDAAWLAAQLNDQAAIAPKAAQAYEYYIGNFPQPMDRAMTARRRLADLALSDSHDDGRYQHWLHEIVSADSAAGPARSDISKSMAAQASLELGQLDEARARTLALTMPVSKSLPQRKAATEAAIASLDRAAGYGYAGITTAATYEIGVVYRDFGRALLDSQRPAQLRGDALEQYNLLLEEQAYPFEEKAIAAHEANLQRLRQGLWNDSIRKSATALAELAPAKYGKREQREASYDSLH